MNPNGGGRSNVTPDAPLALAQLVGDVDRFAGEAWGRSPWRHRTGLTGSALSGLLDLDAVESMLDATARTPFVRLVRADRRVPVSAYVMRASMAGETIDDVVDPEAVHRAFAEGATIVMQGLQRTWHPLVTAALHLERELGHPVQINAYLTPPHAAGLGRHADRHDVFAVQLSGVKHWWVDALGDVTLSPGDVLYLPVGAEHDAHTGDEHSLHLTVGVPRVTYRDVIRRWLDTVGSDALDAPLPVAHHTGGHDLRTLADRFTALAELAAGVAQDETGLAHVVGREADRLRDRRRPLLAGRLATAATPPGPETRLTRRAGLGLTVDPAADEAGRCVVHAGPLTLRMPWSARAAMLQVRDREVVTAASLAAMDEASALVLLRRLVREGVLVAV